MESSKFSCLTFRLHLFWPLTPLLLLTASKYPPSQYKADLRWRTDFSLGLGRPTWGRNAKKINHTKGKHYTVSLSLTWTSRCCELFVKVCFYNKSKNVLRYTDVIWALPGQRAAFSQASGSGESQWALWCSFALTCSFFSIFIMFSHLPVLTSCPKRAEIHQCAQCKVLSEHYTLARPYCFTDSGRHATRQK